MAVALGVKTAARRPGAKEGGREEEEKRSGIAARRTGRLRSMESVTFAWTCVAMREFPNEIATVCVEGIEVRTGLNYQVQKFTNKYHRCHAFFEVRDRRFGVEQRMGADCALSKSTLPDSTILCPVQLMVNLRGC